MQTRTLSHKFGFERTTKIHYKLYIMYIFGMFAGLQCLGNKLSQSWELPYSNTDWLLAVFSLSTSNLGGPRKIESTNLEPSRYLQNINDNTKFLYMLYSIIIYLYKLLK